jgi:phosphopantothenoylcysteine decarboxylase/phosphopantothenate--cysteine ligase
VEVVPVTTAAEMRDAVVPRAARHDVIIMAAAVADYAPSSAAAQKIHKDADAITVTLVKTADIIGELGASRAGGDRPLLVAFAAETERVVEQARKKLVQKHVDLVVANDVSRADAAFDADANEVTLVSADGDEQVTLQPKTVVAGRILDRVEQLLQKRTPALK